MVDRLIREIWVNDNGTVSYDEENSGQRYSWIPGPQVWPAPGPNPGDPGRQYDDTIIGSPANPAADAFTGGPASRREHYFEIPTHGYERLFVEWAGVCMASTGITIDPAILGAANEFNEYADTLLANAHGMAYSDPRERYTRLPPVMCRNINEFNHNFSGMSNSAAGGGSDDLHVRAGNTKRLWVRGPGINFRNLGASRRLLSGGTNMAVTPSQSYAVGTATLCEGTLFRGFTRYDGAGVPQAAPPVNGAGSHLPRAGDMYGFLIEVGWPESAPIDRGVDPSAASYFSLGRLTVDMLERVYLHVCAVMPSGTFASLDFTPGPVLHIVAGRMYAILVKPQAGPKPETIFIDRQGRITLIESTTFDPRGLHQR